MSNTKEQAKGFILLPLTCCREDKKIQ